MDRIGNNVLIVDDDPGMVRLLSKWLDGAGFRVRAAENGRRAVQLIREELPHFLLTDWEMPYMDGLALCRWLREQTLSRYVYTILITVRTGQEDVLRGLEAGVDSFLKKPVDRDELITRLHSGARVLELEQRLRNLARIEPLTGLFTRHTFLELLEKEWSRASRHHLPMSCAILQVDHFQGIREQFGQQTAEECVRRVARMIAADSRQSDVLAHDGADSFLILLPEAGEAQALVWAERMVQGTRELEIAVESPVPLRITASAGIAERMHDTPSATQLLRMTEESLLVAKRSGHDRAVTHRTIGWPTLADVPPRDPATILAGVSARDIMSPLTTSFQHDETVAKAAQFFLRFRTNSVPVVEGGGKLVGILSERDVLTIMLQNEWWTRPISAVMQTSVVSYPDRAAAAEIYDFLCRVSIRGVVIVNASQQPVGMINRGSLLRFFTSTLSDTGQQTAAHAGDRRPELAHAERASGDDAADLPPAPEIIGV